MGVDLSMRGQMRSYGYFSLKISPRSQSSMVSSRILYSMNYIASTGSPATGSQVVLLIISFYNGKKNFSI